MLTYNPEDDSLLAFFDPLAAPLSAPPETPPRNNSPDSASDKENEGPQQQPGPFTVFFNRTYKDASAHNASRSPRGKLIDFGEASFCSQANDETSSCTVDSLFSDDSIDASLSPFVPRRPLADIELEKIAPLTTHLPATILEEPEGPAPPVFGAVSRVTSNAPFTDAIRSINFSALSITDATELQSTPVEFNRPGIAVYPPDAEPVVHDVALSPIVGAITSTPLNETHLSPTSQPFASSANLPTGTRRTHTSTSTSSNDPRRTSVDLPSSFSLHLQSSEMSFDLLNDRLSFLGSPNSSFALHDADIEDDTFDFAKEQLEMERIAACYMKSPSVNVEEDTLDLRKEQRRTEARLKTFEAIDEESFAGVVREIPRVKEFSECTRSAYFMHTLTTNIPLSSAKTRTFDRTYPRECCQEV